MARDIELAKDWLRREKSTREGHESTDYIDTAIKALERQNKIDEAIKILQTIDWIGSGAKARIQEAIELLT